jgi:hypothetical protein
MIIPGTKEHFTMPFVKGLPWRLAVLDGDDNLVEIGYIVSDPTHFTFTNPEFDDHLAAAFNSGECGAVLDGDAGILVHDSNFKGARVVYERRRQTMQ